MKREHVLGMVCGYFLSRFDRDAYEALGQGSQQATHDYVGGRLGVAPRSVANWRDEFDPVHENPRKGRHSRDMYPSRVRAISALEHLSQDALAGLVRTILAEPRGPSADETMRAVAEGESATETVHTPRGPTGRSAEAYFREHHKHHALPRPGTLIDKRDHECGYDYEIVGDGDPVAVEVKGLAGSSGGITFTDKEWQVARAMGERYHLALVRDVATEPRLELLADPTAHLEAKFRAYTVVQTTWTVGQGELSACL